MIEREERIGMGWMGVCGGGIEDRWMGEMYMCMCYFIFFF